MVDSRRDECVLIIESLTSKESGPWECVGIFSHKKSLITIFGHKHKIKNFIKKSTAFEYWSTFGIKLLILKQNYIKND